ncbi:unnamed protein product [Rotaria magnacalcarata]|uniref:Reverse transcriptase domain-containing protein n=1 Tax=Rotaria magnacalcarata TaxID=392030 RepID=A0A816NL03_9BILA|nr:unnamed protein product [Rotaria magnacalcarata]
MGIPKSFLNWIEAWLVNRRAYIEIKGEKSRWFPIDRGGPQGSIFTPTLFITYHSDLTGFLNICSSFLFADDLAAVLGGRIGDKFTSQCINLEKRLKRFLDDLEFYSILTVQPINLTKTEALWSARAIGPPKFDIRRIFHCLHWSDSFFAYVFDEVSLDDRCCNYWERYLAALSDSVDGELLIEQANLNQWRKAWLQKELSIKGLYRSKRYVQHRSVLEKCVQWCSSNRSSYSIIDYDIRDIDLLGEFPDNF